MCEGQNTTWSQFSPSTELSFSGMVVGSFTYWAILVVLGHPIPKTSRLNPLTRDLGLSVGCHQSTSFLQGIWRLNQHAVSRT